MSWIMDGNYLNKTSHMLEKPFVFANLSCIDTEINRPCMIDWAIKFQTMGTRYTDIIT